MPHSKASKLAILTTFFVWLGKPSLGAIKDFECFQIKLWPSARAFGLKSVYHFKSAFRLTNKAITSQLL